MIIACDRYIEEGNTLLQVGWCSTPESVEENLVSIGSSFDPEPYRLFEEGGDELPLLFYENNGATWYNVIAKRGKRPERSEIWAVIEE